MRIRILILLSLVFVIACDRKEELHPKEVDDVTAYVRDVALSTQRAKNAFDRTEKWNEKQRARAAVAALSLLKPEYTESVHSAATSFIARCEREMLYPTLRPWIRSQTEKNDLASIDVVLHSIPSPDGMLPEYFDTFRAWLDLGPESPILEIGHVKRGAPALEWHVCDEAAFALWGAFAAVLPEVKQWNSFLNAPNNADLQKEWREKLPAWLAAHPEARSYWCQEYHEQLKGFVADVRKFYGLERIESAEGMLKKFESEFAKELADRRGICADRK